jgi:sRNA-binding carbon storage regulator CsrA
MLVISRECGGKVAIICPDGTQLWVTIADIDTTRKSPRVRLGITAPRNYAIYREEILPGEHTKSSTVRTTDEYRSVNDPEGR